MGSFAHDFVMLPLDTDDVEVLETFDTKLQTVKVHRNDMTFKVRWNCDSTGRIRR